MNERRTLAAVQALLTDPDLTDKDSALMQDLFAHDGLAGEAAALLSQAAEETIGGIMANALSHMSWLKSRGMREMTSTSDFSALDLNNGHTTVYFVLPPELLGVHQRALRLFCGTFLRAAAKGRKERGKRSTLFFLNEFYALGTMAAMTKYCAVIRGYGARMIVYLQNKGQVEELYGKNADTFFANAGQVVVFAVNDAEGLEYVEKRLGPRVLWRKRVTKSPYGDVTEFEPAGAFSLRGSEEAGRTTGRAGGLMIVLNEGGDPFLLRRTPYKKMFKPGQYGEDPYEQGGGSLWQKFKEWLS